MLLHNLKAGRIPLSYAISNNCDAPIIKMLIDRAPKCIDIPNKVCCINIHVGSCMGLL